MFFRRIFLFLILVPGSLFGAVRPERIVTYSAAAQEALAIFITPDRLLAGSDAAPGDAAALKALNPDLVFVDWTTPAALVTEIRRTGLRLQAFTRPGEWEDVRQMVLKVGQLSRSNVMPILDVLHNQIQSLKKNAATWKSPVTLTFPRTQEDQGLLTEALGWAGFQVAFTGEPGSTVKLSAPGAKTGAQLDLGTPVFVSRVHQPALPKLLLEFQQEITGRVTF